ncbi:MAG: DUF5630 domain-containing protein [Gammaproteobacteria bacterium]
MQRIRITFQPKKYVSTDFFAPPKSPIENEAKIPLDHDSNYYFQQALQIREKNGKLFSEEELINLRKAARLNDFHAIRELQFYYFKQLEISFAEETVEALKVQAEQVAKSHLTPGHLLAATCYIKLANIYFTSHFKMAESAYFHALRHLYFARELSDISKNKMESAYYGESLADAFNKGYVSVLDIQFESYDQLIHLFLEKSALSSTFVKSIERDVIKIAEMIKHKNQSNLSNEAFERTYRVSQHSR